MNSKEAEQAASKSAKRPYLWLLVIPFIWQVLLVPFANQFHEPVLNLPFPMLWQMVGIIVTSVSIAAVFYLDKRRARTGALVIAEGEDRP